MDTRVVNVSRVEKRLECVIIDPELFKLDKKDVLL